MTNFRKTATNVAITIAAAAAFALVPRDQGGTVDPVRMSLEENGNGTLVSWDQVSGAVSYDVIRGLLSAIAQTDVVINLGSVTCIEADSTDESTLGREDADVPHPGEGFFYLIKYFDGTSSSYGAESTAKPRAPAGGDCD